MARCEPRRVPPRKRRQRGDALLESLIAMLLLTVICLALVLALGRSMVAQKYQKAMSLAVQGIRGTLQSSGMASGCPTGGSATAAGCQLVATCDMGVAAEGTRFGVNGIDIGLFCTTPMVALTRAIPPKAAFEMLTTGAFIEAQRACELGLINRVVPGAELSEATLALAQTVAAKLPAAIALGKQAFHQQRGLDLAEAYRLASAEMCENALWSDTAEGTAAFLEKRRPLWQAPR